jgi:hypothetical protein
MAKIGLLFDVSKFESRKMAAQEEFEELHKEDMKEFLKIFQEAFEMTKAESKSKARHFKNKNYNANVMNGNIAGLLLERFPNEVKEGPNDRVMFSRNGKFCIYFKKLDDRKMPSNVRTDYVELVAFQKTLPGGDKMPIVFVGYTVSDDWSELTGVYAVYIQGKKREWVTIISDSNSDDSAVPMIGGQPIKPVAPKENRVRRRKSS